VYLSFFNLRQFPFNLTPDPDFLFLSAQHRNAFEHLLYGINERKGFIEITGEVGTGKTMLCRALLKRLEEEGQGQKVSTALIFNSYLNKDDLLRAISDDFGLEPSEHTSKGVIDTLNTYLLEEFAAGRNAVVVIDEAQNLDPEVLEQVRMLSNLETERGKLLQIILVGQPELREKLATPHMRQLEQRIAVRFHIQALTRTETEQYITHRMSVAGAAHTVVWSRRALWLIHYHTEGIPRRINLLCDRLLMAAFARGTHRVSGSMVRQSVRDIGSSARPRAVSRLRHAAVWAGFSLLVLGVLGAGVLLFPKLHVPWMPWTHEDVPASQPEHDPSPPPEPPAVVVSTPASSIAPMATTPVLIPPTPPLEVDIHLVQTLWRAKTQAEEQVSQSQGSTVTSWEPVLATTLREAGLDVMAWQASPWHLANLTRPCFIEVFSVPSAARPVLVVLVRSLAEGVLMYQEPEGLLTIPWPRLRQMWSGNLYLTMETAKARSVSLDQGASGERVRILQQTLRDLGYFPGVPSGQFQDLTLQAVKRFQRDSQLAVDGRVGRRTLMILIHIGADALASTT
jgi:general secretion pathway protein A